MHLQLRSTTRSQGFRDAEKSLYAVNMGATAIGTGHQRAERICRKSRGSTWRSSPANRSCPPPTCLPRHGTSRVRCLLRRAQEPCDQAVEDLFTT